MTSMTYAEFQLRLSRAHLTAREFAELVGMNRNSVTNCARKGEVPSHLAVIASLMAAMAENGLDFREGLAAVEVQPKKPRGGGTKGRFGGEIRAEVFAQQKERQPNSGT